MRHTLFEEGRRRDYLGRVLSWLAMLVCLSGIIYIGYKYLPSGYQFYRETQQTMLEFSSFKEIQKLLEQEAKDEYTRGFQEGVESLDTAKVCTSWWFSGTLDRRKEIQQAYCKGKK